MPTLSSNTKSLIIISSAISVVLSAGLFQSVGSYIYHTPFVINAALVEEKLDHLKIKYGDTLTSSHIYTGTIFPFIQNPRQKLIAIPAGVDGGKTYLYTIFTGTDWNDYTLKEKIQAKENWKRYGVLQDWEAVYQYIKDFEESHKSAAPQ